MSAPITATFDVTGWDETPYDERDGPHLARATVSKKFTGDVSGESSAELLLCQVDPDDHAAGAGYVASERFSGRVAGRSGSFVIQHGGISGPGLGEHSFGHVVPGSGTDELAGLSGEVEFIRGADGDHSIQFSVSFDGDSRDE